MGLDVRADGLVNIHGMTDGVMYDTAKSRRYEVIVSVNVPGMMVRVSPHSRFDLEQYFTGASQVYKSWYPLMRE